MWKILKKIAPLTCVFTLCICLIGSNLSYAASYGSAKILVKNTTSAAATVSVTATNGATRTATVKSNYGNYFTVSNIKGSTKVTVKFTNGKLADGTSAPTKSFSKTITVKPGKTYTLTPKLSSKTVDKWDFVNYTYSRVKCYYGTKFK